MDVHKLVEFHRNLVWSSPSKQWLKKKTPFTDTSSSNLTNVRKWAMLLISLTSRCSSDGIVSDYGLDGQAIGVWSPTGAKDFSSNLCVQTGSEAHPASCTTGIRGPFPRAKRGRGMTLTTHPHLVPRSGMCRSYTSPPQAPSWRVARPLCFINITTFTKLTKLIFTSLNFLD
jgi:hypothetical protein